MLSGWGFFFMGMGVGMMLIYVLWVICEERDHRNSLKLKRDSKGSVYPPPPPIPPQDKRSSNA